MDGVMKTLAKKNTQWEEDLFFAVKLVWQKRCKYYSQVTPTMGMFIISARTLDSFWNLQSFTKWDNRMYSGPEEETS